MKRFIEWLKSDGEEVGDNPWPSASIVAVSLWIGIALSFMERDSNDAFGWLVLSSVLYAFAVALFLVMVLAISTAPKKKWLRIVAILSAAFVWVLFCDYAYTGNVSAWSQGRNAQVIINGMRRIWRFWAARSGRTRRRSSRRFAG